MFNKLDITKLDYLKVAVLFFPVIIYPPFFFVESFSQSIRVGLLLILCIYLFFGYLRYTVRDAIIFVSFFLLLTILISTNQRGIHGIINIGGYLLTMFFGWLLYRYLLGNNQRVEILLKLYVRFFYLVVICSIFSLIYFQIAGELDLFGYHQDRLKHLVTPFGILYKKDFGYIEVFRSVFFFHEAVHASIFFAANIVIIAPLLKQKSKSFKILNLIGGILIMSMTFYILLAVLYFFYKKRYLIDLILWLIFSLLIYYLMQVSGIVLQNSLSNRLDTFGNFLIAMDGASIKQLFFGHGIRTLMSDTYTSNSGIVRAIFEFGFIGFALQIFILFLLRPNLLIIALFLVSSMVLVPIQMPLFWFLIMVAGEKMRNDIGNSKSLISKSNI